MAIKLIIPGEPVAKGRARVLKNGFSYTPEKTVNYENLVKMCMMEQQQGKKLSGQIICYIAAYFAIPKSASKKKRMQMLSGDLRPTKRPDGDNIAKAVCDALNKLAYDDDSAIVSLQVDKFYSDAPRVEVEIECLRID